MNSIAIMLASSLLAGYIGQAMPLSSAWDATFARHRGRIPVPFLRALAKKESNFNPGENEPPALGLLQVVPEVREGYNKRKGTSYAREDLFNPDINAAIASDLLNRIVIAFGKHPSPNMQEDWRNPEFVKLLLAGWNSGYSEAGGVGRVASFLEARGMPVTHDSVFANAAAAGATKHLSNASKKAWQRTVADLYFAQPDAFRSSGGSVIIAATTAILAGLLIARYL